ncbi:MAG: hypothetical protein NWE94_03205 [Candidatus Bathyarchaeota archaeon]|nr:hypothetical protein [Candidatus Bathyarchaeota archaeon]
MNVGKLFAVLNDGKWHSASELSKLLKTQGDKLVEFAQFLCENGIVEYEYEKGSCRIRILDEWQNLLPIQAKQPPEARHELKLEPWGLYKKKPHKSMRASAT